MSGSEGTGTSGSGASGSGSPAASASAAGLGRGVGGFGFRDRLGRCGRGVAGFGFRSRLGRCGPGVGGGRLGGGGAALRTRALGRPVAEALHQLRELLERQAGDRQHLGRRLEAGAGVERANHVGEPLEHVDADRPLAGEPVAGARIVAGGRARHGRDRDEPGRRRLGEDVEALLERPEHQPEPGRRRLQQERQEHRVLAEADAVLPEGRPAVLVEALHLLGDLAARQHAERLDEAEGDAAGHAAQALVVAERDQRREMLGDAAVEPVAEPALHLLGDGGLGVVVDEGLHLRAERVGAGDELADRVLAPHQPALLGDVDLGVGGVVEPVRQQRQRRRQRGEAGGAQRAGLIGVGGGVEAEAETLETADELVVDRDLAGFGHGGHQALPLLQAPHQNRGAAVDEPLGQLRVQRVRQPVFYRTGLVAPMVGVVDPARRAAPRRSRCGCRPAASTTRRCRRRFGRCARSAAPASRSGCRRRPCRRAGSGTAGRRGWRARPGSPCGSRGSGRPPRAGGCRPGRAGGRGRPALPRAPSASRGRRPRAPAAGPGARAAPRGSRPAARACRSRARCCAIAAA